MREQLVCVRVRLDRAIHVGYQPVLLDGVLSALAVGRAQARDHPDPWSVQHDIPLATYTSPGGQWVFKASAFRPIEPEAPFPFAMVSRIDATRAAQDIEDGLLKSREARPNPAGGMFKTSFFPVFAQWARAWEAYAVGDPEAIGDLLADLDHLGGRRGIGMGAVAGIEVTVASHAPENAWTNRPLPLDFDGQAVSDTAPAMSALRAPYWKRSNFVPALLPL